MSDPTGPIDLECRALSKNFGRFTAVDAVSFSIPSGSFFSILGPSGCGKTTLLRMLAGFLEPSAGDVFIKGRSMHGVAPNKRPVNMVFQHLALFPMMTVADNIAYGLKRRGVAKAEITAKVGTALERIGLPDAGPKRIDQLSGGQKQRVAIARCLVLDPDVLLLDEPLGALDLKLREHMKVELKKLQHEFDTTFVYITHDQSEALVMSDQVAVMNGGRFEQLGSPHELYYRPQTAFVAGFVGDSNRWQGRIRARNGRQVQVATEAGLTLEATLSGDDHATADSPVEIFVRPEAVVIARDPAGLEGTETRIEGTVTSVLFNGANSRVLVRDRRSGDEIDVALPQTGAFSDLNEGQPVYLGWRAETAICFAVDGAGS